MTRIGRYAGFAFFLSAAVLFSNASSAAEIAAIDFSGNQIGQVISTGAVINADGENIGSITADSFVVNHDGNILGGIVPQGIVIGNDNRFLGKVFADGAVRSPGGKMLGRTLPNGLAVDSSGNVIGSVLAPGLIYSPDGDTIGRFTGGGDYTNLEGKKVGFVTSNGYAYRKSGNDYVLDGRLLSAKMVVSGDGKFIGSLTPSGKITGFDAGEIGTVHANGFVYDGAGKLAGGLVSVKYAFNLTGKYMGVVTYNGEVKDGVNTVGYYRPDGNIVNAGGDVLGYTLDIAATADDNYGRYMGYLVPGGKIVRGGDVVGTVGARGYIYDKNGAVSGRINYVGPVYDALARLKGMALRSGDVISPGGGHIGRMKGNLAYDTNGTLIGGVLNGIVAYRDNNDPLGAPNIDASVKSGSEISRVSPFGYVFDSDGKITGESHVTGAVYSVNGLLYSYISPSGGLYGHINDSVLSSGGTLYGKNGYMGGLVNPLYVESLAGAVLGKVTQSNVLLNGKGDVAYKTLPGGYAVEADSAESDKIAPVSGFYGSRVIALNTGGDLIGYADENGTVTDLNNKEYGRVVYNEYVADNNNVIGGKLVPFVPVVNEKCSPIGAVNGKGDVVNGRDVIVGRLLPNGQAVSDVGSYVGYALFYTGLIDFDGKFAGTVNNGMGIGRDGKQLGCVNKRGLIADADNKLKYGIVIPSPVIDFDNNIIGNIAADGKIADAKGNIIGYVQPDGNAVSDTKKNLGNALRYKVAFGNDNKFMGMVQSSGQVTDKDGKNVGRVYFDGSVNKDGETVGYALYDFYVYDDDFATYGYLTRDGTVLSAVGSRLGRIDKGFVLDRKGQVVARGNRDYLVRDASGNIAGDLHLDGTVTDYAGRNVGYLAEAGSVRNDNGEEIAKATPLQYYVSGSQNVKDEDAGPGFTPDYTGRVKINEIGKKADAVPAAREKSSSAVKLDKFGNKVVGIALSPDGDVIGSIYEDDSVKDENGTQIGFRTPDGIIVDMNYAPIGIEEVKHVAPGEMFIPENAFGTGNAYGIGTEPSNLGPGGGYGQGERYDPVRARALAQLQAARRSNMGYDPSLTIKSDIKVSSFTGYEEDGWPGVNKNISSWRVDMSEMILEDKPIPAVLARSIYAGEGFSANVPITAIVERNVYAEEGRNIIIPAGSRVIGSIEGDGESSGGNSGGAVKIAISWRRLIRPDGSQFLFSNATTADAQGRAGAIGYLDEQLLKRYSMPLLTSMLQNATAYLMASGSGSTTTDTSTTSDARSQAAEDARQNFIEQMDNIFDEILERKANIKAVTYVPAGTRIIIFPNQDLWLNSIEREKKKGSGGDGYAGGYDRGGLTSEENSGGGSSSVTYNGNYQENVQPVSGGQGGGGYSQQPVQTGRGAEGYVPPSTNSSQAPADVPPASTDDTGVPELI